MTAKKFTVMTPKDAEARVRAITQMRRNESMGAASDGDDHQAERCRLDAAALETVSRRAQYLRNHLRQLVAANRTFIAWADQFGPKLPPDKQKAFAQFIGSAVEMATDSADHFGLDKTFKQIERDKKLAAQQLIARGVR